MHCCDGPELIEISKIVPKWSCNELFLMMIAGIRKFCGIAGMTMWTGRGSPAADSFYYKWKYE